MEKSETNQLVGKRPAERADPRTITFSGWAGFRDSRLEQPVGGSTLNEFYYLANVAKKLSAQI